MKGRLDIPGAGRLRAVGKLSHDVPLGIGQLHGGKHAVHVGFNTAGQNPQQMPIMIGQNNHLSKNVACYALRYHSRAAFARGWKKVYNWETAKMACCKMMQHA